MSSSVVPPTDQEIQHVTFDGQVIAKLSFQVDGSGSFANPVWIFRDGTVIGSRETLPVIYQANGEFRLDRFQSFLNKFPNAVLDPATPVSLQIQPVGIGGNGSIER